MMHYKKILGALTILGALAAGTTAFAQTTTPTTTSTVTPGAPNTGAGGNTSENLLLLGGSALIALAGGAYLARTKKGGLNMSAKVVLFVTALSLGVFGVTLVHAVWYAPEAQMSGASVAVATTTQAVLAADSEDYPSRLTVPKLTIDANVQGVGIALSGHMAVPSNFTDVAWYKYGALPGQPGTAVMDGHVDNGLSLAGIFKHLDSIQTGDDIYVQTASGIKLHYVVSDVELYPYESVPMAQILTTSGPSRLALITCDGAWVQGQRTYDHRLVVYANLVS